jgi:hypothetical protein
MFHHAVTWFDACPPLADSMFKNIKMIPNEIIDSVLAEIDADELISLTSELVKINSVWDPAAGTSEQEVAQYVARWAEKGPMSLSPGRLPRVSGP